MDEVTTLHGLLRGLSALQRKFAEQKEQIEGAVRDLEKFREELDAAQSQCSTVLVGTEDSIERLRDAEAHLRRLESWCTPEETGVEITIGPVSEKPNTKTNNQ